MRVLLTDPWGSGGVSTFVATLAEQLVARGVEVDVFSWMGPTNACSEYESVGATVIRDTSFRHAIASASYDIVHATDNELVRPFSIPAQMSRIGWNGRLVLTVHQQRAALQAGADAVAFLSAHSKDVSSVGGSPLLAVIPNGVRTASRSIPLELPDLPVALWVGRVEDEPLRQKDFLGFAFAIESLLDTGWAVWVADGSVSHMAYSARDNLRRWFGDRVQFINGATPGQMSHLLDCVRESEGVLISTSREEAFPYAILEALEAGVPVVAPNLPTLADAFVDRGLVEGYEPSVRSMLKAAATARLAPRGRSLPTEYMAGAMCDSYLQIYATVLSRRSVRNPSRHRLLWKASGWLRQSQRTPSLTAHSRLFSRRKC